MVTVEVMAMEEVVKKVQEVREVQLVVSVV